MKYIFFTLICLLTIFCCNCTVQNSVDQLLDIDRKFSDSAGKFGFNKAFIEFAHPDAVLLRENSMPLTGKQAITNIYEKSDTTGIRFSWEPLAGDIAKSGELGYTYGIYTLQIDTTVEKGTYVSIWKIDDNGEWKYVLDSGNEGLLD